MQSPFFRALGLDLSNFHKGTLNLSVYPCAFSLGKPLYFFPKVKWSPSLPPENFSFFSCDLQLPGEKLAYSSLIYWPHPSTKPEFHQDPHVIEVIAPFIDMAAYGLEVEISCLASTFRFFLTDE